MSDDYEITDINPEICRACGERVDAVMKDNSQPPPQDGDYSICAYCGEVSCIVTDPHAVTTLREPTMQELRAFTRAHPNIVADVLRFQSNRKQAGNDR